ncbi:MAG: hypothetical protein AAB553_06415 [Patescibacteria group bacterium]
MARVEDSDSVVTHWPFGSMANENLYTPKYNPEAAGLNAPDQSRALVLGEMLFGGIETAWMNVRDDRRHSPSYRLYFKMEDAQEAAAWQQLAGVNVALQVELSPEKNIYAPSRRAKITRVLGIEQPISTPNSRGYYRNLAASGKVGYIQGTVVEDTTPSDYYHTPLDLGPRTSPATLVCSYTELRSPKGSLVYPSPQAGDEIRARVDRRTSWPNSFRQTEGVIFLLNHEVGQPK